MMTHVMDFLALKLPDKHQIITTVVMASLRTVNIDNARDQCIDFETQRKKIQKSDIKSLLIDRDDKGS